MTELDKAIQFAHDCHRGQYRKGSGIPYITHPIEVMKKLSEWGYRGDSILCAAILHDTIEDCGVTKNELIFKFGRHVSDLVCECTRDVEDSKNLQDKWDFMLSFYDKSHDSVMIKLADRLCNARDYILSGNIKYANWYSLQAYPLYERFVNMDASPEKKEATFDVAMLVTSAAQCLYEEVDEKDRQDVYYPEDILYTEEMCLSVEDIMLNKKPKLERYDG